MISEGPTLIEALPGELQKALNGAVPPDEELVIALRGNHREAFAATAKRVLHLVAPAVAGAAPVEIRETPLAEVREVRVEARPVGGRLIWTAADGERLIEYPTYEGSKYNLVAIRLKQMIGERHTPKPPPQAPAHQPDAGGSACPKCGAGIPATAAWCPGCGLQAFDPCWECGRALPAEANFCAFCGTPRAEPAVIQCPNCRAMVGQGVGYCAACGAQARIVCSGCDRPMRQDWQYCPHCGGEPAWDDETETGEVVAPPGTTVAAPAAPRNPLADPDPESLNRAGTEAYEAERFDEAVRLFKQATQADPNNAGYWTNLGVASSAAGDDATALQAYRKATEINPEEIAAFLYMGQLLMESERETEAREAWERVIAIDPDSEEAEEAREYLRGSDQV